jgi:hypothetical protein
MTTLLELQGAMRRSLVERDRAAAAQMLADGIPPDRLDIYRNTHVSSLTNALRLSYPVVHRLVGAAFFESAAGIFIEKHPPRSADLDEYGGELAEFLRHFGPAASLAYLADVAALEWAVSRALHAPDAKALDLTKLAAIPPQDQGRVHLRAHPSLHVLRSNYPVDAIWRAIMAADETTLASLDLASGPVHLLVERQFGGIQVIRLGQDEWRFLADLCTGRTMQAALDAAGDFDICAALAAHFAHGRFVAFELAGPDAALGSKQHGGVWR